MPALLWLLLLLNSVVVRIIAPAQRIDQDC